MRIGLVCGDGLPVSGLLTVFRNFVHLGVDLGLVQTPVPADLGFSWRPDKPGYFPDGGDDPSSPPWMLLSDSPLAERADPEQVASRLGVIRDAVAGHDRLTTKRRAHIHTLINGLTEMYRERFAAWLTRIDVDWLFAVNMTLSDAVPATSGLHAAARAHFQRRPRPGGVVWWDHDLFASCAIHDPLTGARVYPAEPNPWTPLPTDDGHSRWVVASHPLADEAGAYPTDLAPRALPNVLPTIPTGPLDERHLDFTRRHRLDPSRPVLLAPVRVFRPKGVHLAVRILAAMTDDADRTGRPRPYLLVFGSLTEEPDYAHNLARLTTDLDVADDVRYLDGVPLQTHPDPQGWHLDEIDLLRLAAATHGGVLFTPAVPDVETVGLGPALAAVAGLPFLTTGYDAFTPVYGPHLIGTHVAPTAEGIPTAAAAFGAVLDRFRNGDSHLAGQLRRNSDLVTRKFDDHGWRQLLHHLNAASYPPPSPATPHHPRTAPPTAETVSDSSTVR